VGGAILFSKCYSGNARNDLIDSPICKRSQVVDSEGNSVNLHRGQKGKNENRLASQKLFQKKKRP
jgi:hypothetical protein